MIWYIYDSNGEIVGFTYNEVPYYYLKNQQGDVYKIVDQDGEVVGSYTYDPWGKVLTCTGTMAEINPIRYRSYYYDTETGYYYLQSRYYDPELGRFISADSYASTGQGILGHNVFAYCLNNPIAQKDQFGNNSTEAISGVSSLLGWLLSLIDGPLPIADCAVLLFSSIIISNKHSSGSVSRAKYFDIDLDKTDKNHIIKGTKGKHIAGWKRFGFDPQGDNGWKQIVPIIVCSLKYADEVKQSSLADGSRIYIYIKNFAQVGVTVVVKIWESADGLVRKLSDAIPRIVD